MVVSPNRHHYIIWVYGIFLLLYIPFLCPGQEMQETYKEKILLQGKCGHEKDQLYWIPFTIEGGETTGVCPPTSFAIDYDGSIYFVDVANNKIKQFHPNGYCILEFVPENIRDIWDIAVSNGKIYLLYCYPFRILKYTDGGKKKKILICSKDRRTYAYYIEVDDSGNVYTEDYNAYYPEKNAIKIDSSGRIVKKVQNVRYWDVCKGEYFLNDGLINKKGDVVLSQRKIDSLNICYEIGIIGIDLQKNVYMTLNDPNPHYVKVIKISPEGHIIAEFRIRISLYPEARTIRVGPYGNIYVLQMDFEHFTLWKYEKSDDGQQYEQN